MPLLEISIARTELLLLSAMRTLSVTVLLCFISNVLTAQSHHKTFKLEEKLSFKTPTRFFIKDVVDERTDTNNIGYVDVGIFNSKVPAQIVDGLAGGIKRIIDRDVIKDTSLLPVIVVIRKFQVSEARDISHEYAYLDSWFEFVTFIGQQKIVLADYNTTSRSGSQLDVTHSHPILITNAVSKSLSDFDGWLNDNYSKFPIYEQVKVNVQFHPLTQSQRDTLYYSKERKLIWSDFKLPGNTADSLDAKSFLGIGYYVTSSVNEGFLQLDVSVNCFFIPEKSWVRPGTSDNDLLGHEQLHFDIAYLVGKKFRDAILSYKFSRDHFGQEIEQLKNKSAAEYDQLQTQYDAETNHGKKRVQQKIWKNKIESALQ